MPGGALVGTVVHGVLERTDFAAADLEQEVSIALAKEVAWRNIDLGDPEAWSRASAVPSIAAGPLGGRPATP